MIRKRVVAAGAILAAGVAALAVGSASGAGAAATASRATGSGPATVLAAADLSAATTSAPAAVKLHNGSVILDSGTNFTEPDGSEGVAGPGCRNVGQPHLASSLQLVGGPIKIWTGRNCTGTSAVVTHDIADLGKIGFDKKIVSIRFGR